MAGWFGPTDDCGCCNPCSEPEGCSSENVVDESLYGWQPNVTETSEDQYEGSWKCPAHANCADEYEDARPNNTAATGGCYVAIDVPVESTVDYHVDGNGTNHIYSGNPINTVSASIYKNNNTLASAGIRWEPPGIECSMSTKSDDQSEVLAVGLYCFLFQSIVEANVANEAITHNYSLTITENAP